MTGNGLGSGFGCGPGWRLRRLQLSFGFSRPRDLEPVLARIGRGFDVDRHRLHHPRLEQPDRPPVRRRPPGRGGASPPHHSRKGLDRGDLVPAPHGVGDREEIRARLDEQGKAIGWPAMHSVLAKVDPVTATRLQPNDSQRVQRALEVYEITGKPMSELLADSPSEDGREGSSIPEWINLISLEPSDRSRLHHNLEKRFDEMLTRGLLEEVQLLRKNPDLHGDLPAIRSVGYRQVWEYLSGEVDQAEMRYKALAATRQLGKRQLTWLRAISGRKTFDPFNPDEMKAALEYCKQSLN